MVAAIISICLGFVLLSIVDALGEIFYEKE